MKTLLQAVSGVALLGTIGPPLLFLLSRIDLGQTKLWMAASALVWFAVTPFWMDRESSESGE